jgi:hypothetical protein
MENIEFEFLYAGFIQNYLNREISASDKIAENQILVVEQNLGFSLPKALRDYHKTIGNCRELNNYHNRILEIDKIFIDESFLVFAEENQNVVYWGIKTTSLDEINPIIWQIRNEEKQEYYSEDKTFTEFMTELFDWQFNL